MTSLQRQSMHFNYGRQHEHQRINKSPPSLSSMFQKIQTFFTSFIIVIINFFTSLPFRIMQKILYFFQKALRYILWINIKGLVSWVNFVYRFFAFFRVTKIVTLLQMIAKTYFPEYSMVDFNRAEQNISRYSLIMRKKTHDLINVDKLQKKIKTPTYFQNYANKYKKRQQQQTNTQSQNPSIVTQKSSIENNNQSSSPRLLRLTQSHQKMKKGDGGRGPSRGGDLRINVPQDKSRVFPDRDISPQRYMKPIPKISDETFQDKSSQRKSQKQGFYDQEIQVPPYPTLKESQFAKQSRQQLEKQLFHLRQKMQELIEDNTSYIKDLQEWLKQKSQTIMMTRTQNIQLLQEMQQLQKQNIKKTQKLETLQQKIKEMQEILEKQKSETGELCHQIVVLNQEIQTKSIQLIVLKDKINQNLRKFQQYQKSENPQHMEQKPQKPQGKKQNEDQTQQDKLALERLKKQEKRTEQLNTKVQKVLYEERRRLQKAEEEEPNLVLNDPKEIDDKNRRFQNAEDQQNLILDDPRQVENISENESAQFKESKSQNKQRKKSEPTVIKQDGKSRITMTIE